MNLSELIRAHKGDSTWEQLSERGGGYPGAKRWQQYGLNKPVVKNFPDPPTITALAKVLGVSEEVVIRAAAETLGLPMRDEGGLFVTMMRSLRGTEHLTDGEVSAFVSLVRVAVERAAAARAAEEAAAAAAEREAEAARAARRAARKRP